MMVVSKPRVGKPLSEGRGLARVPTVAVLAMVVTGCASWFLNGAEEHSGAPAQYVARFTVPSCTMSDGSQGPGTAGQWYFLAQDERGPVLYELDAQGEGSVIRNWWSDEHGQNFFVWVRGSHGWVFSFPNDRSQLPTRYVFFAGTYTTQTNENGMSCWCGRKIKSNLIKE